MFFMASMGSDWKVMTDFKTTIPTHMRYITSVLSSETDTDGINYEAEHQLNSTVVLMVQAGTW